MSTILCIDDEPSVGAVLEDTLTAIGHRPVLAATLDEALELVDREPVDLIISDYRLPNATGFDLLDQLKDQGYEVPVIIMTGYTSIEHAVLSIKRGAVDYLTKPLRVESLRLAVNNAIELSRLRREFRHAQNELRSLRGARKIVGRSMRLREVMETIATVAPTRATVLLHGESGTGKELFARAIHARSPRSDREFVTVNCAALPEGRVESSLFGYERGAYPGATQRTPGAFEQAHGGTLMLDEIAEMHPDPQAKLLRVLQEQEVTRVGGNVPIQVDVRIIATTNRNLLAEVEARRFREDLYYRLNVVGIRTPPLRERLDDVPLLVEHFVAHFSEQLGIKPPEVTAEAVDHLRRSRWPGNVRELANAVERAVILRRGDRLEPDSFLLPRERKDSSAAGLDPQDHGSLPESLNLKRLEAWAIDRALERTAGHRIRAAELLGISERTLRNRLKAREEESGGSS